ncbi:hypothetical protein [Actinomyces sp. oral taxon 414]|uniref:hypothetical protein n=1 Tax=Actinomyces sp. oral taxon 414 TaxID=712122 RepID=UPI000A452E81|nr:hypothetical protein [Actinomyces sp. oral taxon 414]
MTQPSAPYTNSGMSDKLVVQPQDNIVRSACGILYIIILLILTLAVMEGMTTPSYYRGSGSSSALYPITIFLTLFSLAPIGYLLWRIHRASGTRTTVDDSGLLLEQPGMQTLFIPWRNAHGRITVKTVTQYVPGAATPATMSLVLVALDQEEIVLPGSVLSSYRPRNLTQRSYATAVQILAYDPWGQREPLMQSENNFTPWMPRDTFYT